MLNLAAFRYRNVMAAAGGPVERLTCGEVSVLGSRWFEANAYLSADHAPSRCQKFIYGSADGSGTDLSPMIARFKAVSEAIERWAHMAVLAAKNGARYGFDLDSSSNGMAAFPGIFRRQARMAALSEAVERFNLLHWWEGRLPAHEAPTAWPETRAVVIRSDTPGVTVVLYRKRDRGHVSYGHAAAPTFDAACRKAAVEMERHDAVIRYYALCRVGKEETSALPESAHPLEQRCLFFAMEEGHALFCERLRSGMTGPVARPQLVFDGAVRGPWDRYASVWRVLFAPPSDRFLSGDARYFLW